MQNYAIGIGHNVLEANLTLFDPQPFCEGVQHTRRTNAAPGNVWDEGAFVWFVFEVLLGDAEYVDLLTMANLITAKTAEVTVRVRNEFYQPQIVNGLAVRPNVGTNLTLRRTFPSVRLLVKHLEPVT